MQNPDATELAQQLPVEDHISANRHPTPDDPPWTSPAAIGLWVASVLLVVFVPAIFLLPYLAMVGAGTEQADIVEFAKTDATAVFLQVLAILPAHLLTIALAWFLITRNRRFNFTEMIGWQSGGFRWWHYVTLLGAFMVVAAIVGSYIPEQENDLIRILKSSRSAVYIVAFVATFTAPFVEEVVYRGMLYSAFQRSMGVPAAFVAVTLLFALVHVPQYYPSVSTIFLLTVLSLLLTAIRVKTGNLLPCVIFHTIFNGLQSVFLIAEPYFNTTPVADPAAVIRLLVK